MGFAGTCLILQIYELYLPAFLGVDIRRNRCNFDKTIFTTEHPNTMMVGFNPYAGNFANILVEQSSARWTPLNTK